MAENTELKKCLVEMLEWFHAFCVSHGLKYYAVNGTLLGAVRHKGFIPWDDDIDVAMPRKDYQKLIDIMGNDIHDEKYLIETPYSPAKDFIYTYSKLYNTNTTLIDRGRKNIVRGVYIDIFPLDGIGNTIEESRCNYRPIAKRLDLLAASVLAVRKGRAWYKNLAVRVIQLMPSFLLDPKKLILQIDKLCRERDFDTSQYVGNLPSTWRFKDVHLRKYFGTPTLYEFEGKEVYGPEYYDEYLTTLYGDWRQLPPIEKRISNHVREDCNLNKSFLLTQ